MQPLFTSDLSLTVDQVFTRLMNEPCRAPVLVRFGDFGKGDNSLAGIVEIRYEDGKIILVTDQCY